MTDAEMQLGRSETSSSSSPTSRSPPRERETLDAEEATEKMPAKMAASPESSPEEAVEREEKVENEEEAPSSPIKMMENSEALSEEAPREASGAKMIASAIASESAVVVASTIETPHAIDESASAAVSRRPLSALVASAKNANNLYGGSKKRKGMSMSVNLMEFVRVLEMAFEGSVVTGKKFIIPDNYTEYYVRAEIMNGDERAETKKQRAMTSPKTGTAKISMIAAATTIAPPTSSAQPNDAAVVAEMVATPTMTAAAKLIKRRYKEALYLELLMHVAQDLELRGATFQFSREALKYFLATHVRLVSRDNFLDTNHLQKTDKVKNKTHQQLSAGAILLEYVKGTDAFTNALYRSCRKDVGALKRIIDADIRIPASIYDLPRKVKCARLQYQETQGRILSPMEYVKIPIPGSAFKRAQVMITRYLVLLQDGNSFSINSTIEKDFSPLLMDPKNRLPQNGYIVFDASIGVKSKIIDVVAMSVEGQTLSDLYHERMSFVTSRYPEAKTFKSAADTGGNNNYLFKPLSGFGPSYVKQKPLLTAAVIGISDRHAHAALVNEEADHELIAITRFGVSGPAACMIATSEFQKLAPVDVGGGGGGAPQPSILVNGESYSITGDLDKVSLFREAVPVEIKDAHKFGGVSDRQISTRDEYKQMFHTTKESKNNDSLLEMINDPSKIEELVEILSSSVCFDRLRALMDCKVSFEANF